MDEYSRVRPDFGISEQKVLALHEWEEGAQLPRSTREIHTNALTNLTYMERRNPYLATLSKRFVSGQAGAEIDHFQEVLQAPVDREPTT
jgi:hypothetical protein